MGNKKILILLCIVVFLTNLSQLPYFVSEGTTQYLSFPAWMLTIGLFLLWGLVKIKRTELRIISIGWIFMIGVLFSELVTPFNHLSSNMIQPFYLSLLVILIGLFASDVINQNDIKYIIISYIVSTLIVSVSIYLNYFSIGFDWNSRNYAYTSKNSFAQILLTSLIFLYILIRPKSLFLKASKWLILLFWFILLLSLQSRATILGLFIAIIMIILFSKLDKKIKVGTLTLTTMGALLVLLNPEINASFIDGVLLGGRDATNIDDISSNRYSHIFVLFPELFAGNEFLGTGTYYVENFILNVLLKHGILFGWVMILIALWPIVWGIKQDKKDPILSVFFILSLVYFTNGLFEAQAPFGPGTKNYILWLMFGILYGIQRKNKKLLMNSTRNEKK